MKTALGIDIGARRISAALVEKTDQGVKVIAAGTGDLPAGGSKKQLPPGKVLSRLLRTLGKHGAARGVRAAVTLSTGSVVMRLLDLPRQMPANVSEFVKGELRQYVALSGRSMSSDFCGIGSAGPSKRLLAVAADAAELGEILQICRAAGVAAVSVEPAALACARAFLTGEKGQHRSGHALLAVLSRHNLIVCLFRRGNLDFIRIREIPIGMETPAVLCTWLAEELNAVQRYCRTGATADNAEWHTHLVMYDALYPRDVVASLLVRESGMETVTVAECGELIGPAVAETAASSASMAAVGAALKLLDLEGDELRIDLTPAEVVQARSSLRRGLILANAAAVVFVGVFLLVQLLARTTEAMEQRITQTRIEENLYTMPAAVAQNRFADAEILRMERQLAALETIRTRRDVDWPAVLSTIAQATPAAVCISHLGSDDSESLLMSGLALSAPDARAFVQSLDGKAPFESVRLARMQQRQAGADVVEYEIICTLKPFNQEHDGDQGS